MPEQDEMQVNEVRGPRSGLWIAVGVAAVVVLAGAVAFAGGVDLGRDHNAAAGLPAASARPSPSVRLVSVSGGVRMTLGGKRAEGSACTQGFRTKDVHEGTQVAITDAAGTVLATPALGPGKAVDALGGMTSDCRFPFSAQIPAGAGPYGFEVGSGHGVVHYEEAFLHKSEIEMR
jgi:hypothetical protein